jgi:hypothetical protein
MTMPANMRKLKIGEVIQPTDLYLSTTVIPENWDGLRKAMKQWMVVAKAGETFKTKKAVVVCTKGRRPKETSKGKTHTVLLQPWTESESEPGFGVTQRNDGFSLHKTLEDRQKFIDDYCKDRKGPTPSIYDFPQGHAYEVRVPTALYRKVCKNFGIRSYSTKDFKSGSLVQL